MQGEGWCGNKVGNVERHGCEVCLCKLFVVVTLQDLTKCQKELERAKEHVGQGGDRMTALLHGVTVQPLTWIF